MNIYEIEEVISTLKHWRSEWALYLITGYSCSIESAKQVPFKLYTISGCIILAFEQLKDGFFRDKLAMVMLNKELEDLVKSDIFRDFDNLCKAGAFAQSTNHHIRVMFDCLGDLTK